MHHGKHAVRRSLHDSHVLCVCFRVFVDALPQPRHDEKNGDEGGGCAEHGTDPGRKAICRAQQVFFTRCPNGRLTFRNWSNSLGSRSISATHAPLRSCHVLFFAPVWMIKLTISQTMPPTRKGRVCTHEQTLRQSGKATRTVPLSSKSRLTHQNGNVRVLHAKQHMCTPRWAWEARMDARTFTCMG